MKHIKPLASGSEDSATQGFGGKTIVVRRLNLEAQPSQQEVSMPSQRHSNRQLKRGQRFNRGLVQPMLTSMEEPRTHKEALEYEDSLHWREAWVSEVDSFALNNT